MCLAAAVAVVVDHFAVVYCNPLAVGHLGDSTRTDGNNHHMERHRQLCKLSTVGAVEGSCSIQHSLVCSCTAHTFENFVSGVVVVA